jgi:hypothetical protein
MQTRISINGYLAAIGILFLVGHAGLAQPTIRGADGVGRFRDLKWGTTIEQASKTYQDLGFERYEISNSKKEEPSKVYVRRGEHGEIEEIAFDSIEYWFKGDHLHQVRAILHSRIGPRTLVTRAEYAFDKITGKLRGRFGDPSGHKVNYVTEFIVVVKESTWIVDHSAITVKYEGAGRTNEDLFIFTMQEKTKR